MKKKSQIELFIPINEDISGMHRPNNDVNNLDDAECDPRKSFTDDDSLDDNLKKEALGLFDLPAGAPDGAQNFRGRDSYNEEDFEVSDITGFGGKSLVDINEDKHPANIQRRHEFNSANNDENRKKDFFSFLGFKSTGKSMNKELEKLTSVLSKSGYSDVSAKINKSLNIKTADDKDPEEAESNPEYEKARRKTLTIATDIVTWGASHSTGNTEEAEKIKKSVKDEDYDSAIGDDLQTLVVDYIDDAEPDFDGDEVGSVKGIIKELLEGDRTVTSATEAINDIYYWNNLDDETIKLIKLIGKFGSSVRRLKELKKDIEKEKENKSSKEKDERDEELRKNKNRKEMLDTINNSKIIKAWFDDTCGKYIARTSSGHLLEKDDIRDTFTFVDGYPCANWEIEMGDDGDLWRASQKYGNIQFKDKSGEWIDYPTKKVAKDSRIENIKKKSISSRFNDLKKLASTFSPNFEGFISDQELKRNAENYFRRQLNKGATLFESAPINHPVMKAKNKDSKNMRHVNSLWKKYSGRLGSIVSGYYADLDKTIDSVKIDEGTFNIGTTTPLKENTKIHLKNRMSLFSTDEQIILDDGFWFGEVKASLDSAKQDYAGSFNKTDMAYEKRYLSNLSDYIRQWQNLGNSMLMCYYVLHEHSQGGGTIGGTSSSGSESGSKYKGYTRLGRSVGGRKIYTDPENVHRLRGPDGKYYVCGISSYVGGDIGTDWASCLEYGQGETDRHDGGEKGWIAPLDESQVKERLRFYKGSLLMSGISINKYLKGNEVTPRKRKIWRYEWDFTNAEWIDLEDKRIPTKYKKASSLRDSRLLKLGAFSIRDHRLKSMILKTAEDDGLDDIDENEEVVHKKVVNTCRIKLYPNIKSYKNNFMIGNATKSQNDLLGYKSFGKADGDWGSCTHSAWLYFLDDLQNVADGNDDYREPIRKYVNRLKAKRVSGNDVTQAIKAYRLLGGGKSGSAASARQKDFDAIRKEITRKKDSKIFTDDILKKYVFSGYPKRLLQSGTVADKLKAYGTRILKIDRNLGNADTSPPTSEFAGLSDPIKREFKKLFGTDTENGTVNTIGKDWTFLRYKMNGPYILAQLLSEPYRSKIIESIKQEVCNIEPGQDGSCSKLLLDDIRSKNILPTGVSIDEAMNASRARAMRKGQIAEADFARIVEKISGIMMQKRDKFYSAIAKLQDTGFTYMAPSGAVVAQTGNMADMVEENDNAGKIESKKRLLAAKAAKTLEKAILSDDGLRDKIIAWMKLPNPFKATQNLERSLTEHHLGQPDWRAGYFMDTLLSPEFGRHLLKETDAFLGMGGDSVKQIRQEWNDQVRVTRNQRSSRREEARRQIKSR